MGASLMLFGFILTGIRHPLGVGMGSFRHVGKADAPGPISTGQVESLRLRYR